MNTTRRGKVARLPKATRDELNTRLMNGQKGKKVLEWLNGLEEVKAVMTEEFGGQAVSEHNLTQWRKGGHQDWLLRQEAADNVQNVVEGSDDAKEMADEPIADKLSVWVAAEYCAVATDLRRTTSKNMGKVDEENWKRLRELCKDVVALRRGDNYGERRHLIKEQLELGRTKMWKKRSDEFWRWAEDPRVREALEVKYMTEEERMRAVRSIFGMADAGVLTREPEETDKDRERRLCEIFGYVDLKGTPTHKYVNGEFVRISPESTVSSLQSGTEHQQREGDGYEYGCALPPHPGPLPEERGNHSLCNSEGGGVEEADKDREKCETETALADGHHLQGESGKVGQGESEVLAHGHHAEGGGQKADARDTDESEKVGKGESEMEVVPAIDDSRVDAEYDPNYWASMDQANIDRANKNVAEESNQDEVS